MDVKYPARVNLSQGWGADWFCHEIGSFQCTAVGAFGFTPFQYSLPVLFRVSKAILDGDRKTDLNIWCCASGSSLSQS